eukprot:CAMPEP_0172313016 /NCGR_PEP_ID=MMETSP1058-20130122/19134_1 /TAXON_ID=83371 /ORGANISM="Detonula confervacea, Strain CCMP 353" /LENGTH=208 /DNA_ID=CAMNT_0013026597 /DNA_START=95 /DNA_END=721 /DNA_ORIENTATION=+
MSDARNSSNNIRGGGSKQTGGSGRTNKYAQGNNRTNLLGGLEGQAQGERSEAKRKLQLLVSSKQLAADVRALLLQEHTEQEYTDAEIPLPSTEDAKKKLKAMKEFTDKWYDKGFREEWLQTVTGVWIAEIKAQYEAAVAAAAATRQSNQQVEGEPQSIEELTEMIANLDASVSLEERQRLKKKLKGKKKRAKDKEKEKAKKAAASTSA